MRQQALKYGASPLHFAVWRGDGQQARLLLNEGDAEQALNALDEDGQSPWAWAEAKGNESMMEILREYGGGPSAVWCLQVEPHQQEAPWKELQYESQVSPWSSSVFESVVLQEQAVQERMWVSCTNLAGEKTFHHEFPLDTHVASVLGVVKRNTGQSPTFVLPNNYILGIGDGRRALKDLLDSPPKTETRKDKDGLQYTQLEFFKYYGFREGSEIWAAAAPDEVEVACAKSLLDMAKEENDQISEAVSRSLRESESGDEGVKILVIGFNKHPMQFTNAICESAFVQSLCMRGIDVCPEWANGAKILIEGLTPSMMEEANPPFAPADLRRSHVVVLPENEKDVTESLMGLKYRERPREQTRKTVTCLKLPFENPQCEGIAGDGSERCEEHEVEEEGLDFSSVCEPLLGEFCVTRTFIDVCKSLRVGWRPRSDYTKSSNDGHGIENPRMWK